MNLFVGGLSPDVTSKDLGGLFQSFGKVLSSKIIWDRETGSSRGFGFVYMAEPAEARLAMDKLHRTEFMGKVINVFKAGDRD